MRRLDWVPLTAISPALSQALIAAEDKRFYEHHGVDWQGLAGAAWDSISRSLDGRRVRGGSTLTMQLAGLLDPALAFQGNRRSLRQKWDQAQAALALERSWTKAEILEAYLNLAPYRGELSGLDAAARGLFGKTPSGLDARESALLVALLRGTNAPVVTVAQRGCAVAAQAFVDVPCADIRTLAFATLSGGYRLPPRWNLAPHLAARYLQQPGERVATTLDAAVQRQAIDILRSRLADLAGHGVEDGAIIVLDNASGDVLAWVGSSGERSGAREVDGVVAPRQAGSTLKPFLYALALDGKLLTAASLTEDSPLAIPTDRGLYTPQNYDRDFHGLVSVRTALASSLNVPAVRTLGLVGLARFRENLQALGVRFETNKVIGKTFSIPQLMGEMGFDAVFVGAGADEHRVEAHLAHQLRNREGLADHLVGLEPDAQRLQVLAETCQPDEAERPHRGHVQRTGERRAHADEAVEVAIVILRCVEPAVGRDGQRRVFGQRCGGQQLAVEGEGVQERLERRTGLARRDDTVDFAGARALAAASHPGQHVAAGIVENDDGAVFHAVAGEIRQPAAQDVDCLPLHGRVERRRDALTRLLQIPRGEVRCQIPARRQPIPAGKGCERQRADVGAGDVDEGLSRHRAAALRYRHHRRVGPAEQRDQQGRLARVESGRRLAEQPSRGGVEPAQLAAIRREVQVGLENLGLGPAALQGQRRLCLVPLLPQAAPVALEGQRRVEQARELHRQRGAAAYPPAVERARNAVPGGAGQPLPVDAVVLVEALVLRRDQRLRQCGRDGGQRHPVEPAHARVDPAFGQRLAMAVDCVAACASGARTRVRLKKARARNVTGIGVCGLRHGKSGEG